MSTDSQDSLELARQVRALRQALREEYRLDLDDLAEAVRWVARHRSFMDRLRTASALAAIAIFASAVSAALWAGVRALLGANSR